MGYKVFIDFEMAPIPKKYKEERSICRQEIIQIGAVILNDEDVEVGSFKRNIAPKYIDELPRKLIKMLDLSINDLKYSCKIEAGIVDFVNWVYSYSDDVSIYAWSNSDFAQLVHEIKLKDIDVDERFLKLLGAWYDLQVEFDHIVGSKDNTGLKTALEYCGILFEGKQHDSTIDSRNTAQVYREMRNPEELLEMIENTKKYTQKKSECTYTLGDMFDFSQFISSTAAV